VAQNYGVIAPRAGQRAGVVRGRRREVIRWSRSLRSSGIGGILDALEALDAP
jgi:hypothetical protein